MLREPIHTICHSPSFCIPAIHTTFPYLNFKKQQWQQNVPTSYNSTTITEKILTLSVKGNTQCLMRNCINLWEMFMSYLFSHNMIFYKRKKKYVATTVLVSETGHKAIVGIYNFLLLLPVLCSIIIFCLL